MGPYKYRIVRINGDYAELKRVDVADDDIMPVSMALLPDGVDESTLITWENFEYSID